MKFCPSCGAKKLREQDRFCMNCGEPYPVLADLEEPAAATDTVETAAIPVPAPAPADSAPEAPGAAAPAPMANTAAANVQPSKLAGRAAAQAGQQPAGAVQPAAPAPTPPIAPKPAPVAKTPAAPVPAAATAPEFAPVQPAAIPVEDVPAPVAPAVETHAQPESLFEQPVALPTQDTGVSQPAPQAVEAEAASLRDSIDKMLGGEPAAQPAPPAQPRTLFDQDAEEFSEPPVQQAPFAGNVFDEANEPEPVYEAPVFEEEVYEEAVQYDEYGNPVEAVAEETLFEQPAEGYAGQDDFGVAEADTLGFNAVDDGGSLFEEPATGGNLFAASPAPRQQFPQEQREVPRKQRYEDLNQAVQTAGGPEAVPGAQGGPSTEKWQRLQQDNIEDLYAREERKQKPPEIPLPEYTEKKGKKRRGGGGRTVGIIVTAVIVFVVGTLGATMGLLYYRNSPSKAIDAFMEALEDGNYNTMNSLVELNGVEGTTDGWAAFTASFESASARRDLQNQLKNQAKKGTSASDEYPAVVMESEPLFLFVNRYYITIEAIDLLAEGIYEVDGSTINGLFMKGEANDAGRIYSGLMPGRYNYEIFYNGQELSGEIDAFETETANKLTGNAGIVDNTEQPEDGEQPEGEPEDNTPEGDEVPVSVVSSEEPAEETTDAAQLANSMNAAAINAVLESYYRSYLTSINDQTTDTLKNSTAANNAAMATRITADNNASNTFEYVGVNTDANSIEASDVNGVATVTFVADFTYRYTPREGEAGATDSGNRQKVTMVYEDNEWRVTSMEFVTD